MRISDFFKNTFEFVLKINKTKRETIALNALKGNWNGVLVECINDIVPLTKKEHIFNYNDEELNKIIDASFIYGVNKIVEELAKYYGIETEKPINKKPINKNKIDDILTDLNESINLNKHLEEVIPNRYVYHTSNPIFRNKIAKEGLIPKGKSEAWLSDTKIEGKVIFVVNSNEENYTYDSTYDDDIYKIDTKNLNNKWYNDPNFDSDNLHFITFENIPRNSIKLIYKGTGDSE